MDKQEHNKEQIDVPEQSNSISEHWFCFLVEPRVAHIYTRVCENGETDADTEGERVKVQAKLSANSTGCSHRGGIALSGLEGSRNVLRGPLIDSDYKGRQRVAEVFFPRRR